MKHDVRSASSFEFACPHFSDHRTQQAKPKQNDHGRSVPSPVHPLSRPFPVSVYSVYSVVNRSLFPSLPSVRTRISSKPPAIPYISPKPITECRLSEPPATGPLKIPSLGA